MRSLVPVMLVLLGGVAVLFTVFGGDNYAHLNDLRSTLQMEHQSNQMLKEQVEALRREVSGLQTNDRTIEKAARNELALARPEEMIFLFDGESSNGEGQR